HLRGVMLAAGGSLRWLREQRDAGLERGGDPYDRMCAEAARIPPGAEGLTFLPYLTGERTPHADPHARGVFFGLSLRHTRAHLIRSVLEGVAYGMTDSLELIRGLGTPVRRVRLSGGGARSPLWCRIQAAMYGAPGATLTREEGPALGAAVLAGIGTGVFPSYGAAIRTCVHERATYRPVQEWSRAYARGHRTYQELYTRLRTLYKQV
ncbi:MAG: FGGY-family carbohydrate kinase, partial [bacterium]